MKIKITDLADVQPGDMVHITLWPGTEDEAKAKGPARLTTGNKLAACGYTIRHPNGSAAYSGFRFATRKVEKPVLPTEPGSAIWVYEARRETYEPGALGVRSDVGNFATYGHKFNGCTWHHPEDITRWSPVEVTVVKP